MFDDLPPDLARLLTLRVWHTLWLQRIDAKIAALEEREAEREQGRRNRPAEPDWVVELGIGNGRPPVEVHLGGCYAAGARRRPVPRDEARRLLVSGVRACGHCRPDTALDIADLSTPPAPSIPPAAETLTAPCGQSDVCGISWPGAAAGAVMSSSSMASWSGVPGSAV
ncbi:DUF6233 domain-containing protein [Streptomyces aureus]|uniref:DUF6233 domain-containing protein n=1 Tax=Streptomyces aureus TaxID=193461 RepID=UPI00341026F8